MQFSSDRALDLLRARDKSETHTPLTQWPGLSDPTSAYVLTSQDVAWYLFPLKKIPDSGLVNGEISVLKSFNS